jgi:hypothetical protein
MNKETYLSVISVVLLLSSVTAEWIPDHVRYIDSAPEFGNYLFRGSLPVSATGEFLYQDLQRQLQIAAKYDNVLIPNITFNIVGALYLRDSFQKLINLTLNPII